METADPRRTGGEPDFIPGIYNYCDRWCERCGFTGRCRNFVPEDEPAALDHWERDEENRLFWEALTNPCDDLECALELEEDEPEEQEDWGFGEDVDDMLAERVRQNHDCSLRAERYLRDVETWRKSAGLIEFDEEGHVRITPGHQPLQADHAVDAADAFEVIWWYYRFIFVKIRRALSSLDRERDDDPASLRDCDGSAKIALIAIDRSLAAWRSLQRAFPALAESITPFLLSLAVLRRRLEETFPCARSFKRAGLDDAE